MGETMRTAALGAGSVPAAGRSTRRAVTGDPDDGLSAAADQVLARLWRLATSMRVALVLLMALSVLALIGTLLVQSPSGITANPEAYAVWLEGVRPRFGGWTGVLDALGFFSIFSSWWFKAIVLGLVTSIASCSVNRFRGLWHTAVKPRTRMTPTFYARAPHTASVAALQEPDDVVGRVRATFGARHYRTVAHRDGDEIHVYADRFRWAPFGTLFSHLSLILILVGALASGLGFRNDSFAVPVGSTVDVGYGTGLSVEARSFSDSYYPNGAPADYASFLVLRDQSGAVVAEQTIRVNEPLSYGGVTFYQSFFGPSATVQVTDGSGAVLYDAGVPLLWVSEDGNRRIGKLTIDDPELTVFVIQPASGKVDPLIRPGQARFEAYRNETDPKPIAMELASQGQRVDLAGLGFTFVREQQFTGLQVARDPGAPLVWIGALLLVTGLFLVFFFPNRRIWVRIHRQGGASEVQLAATTRHDATFGPEFGQIVSDVRLSLTGSGAA